MRAALATAAAVAMTVAAPAAAPGEADIVSVEPQRDGGLLAARVRTVRLPGGRILASLDSGLPSAIEMRLDLRDDRNRSVGERAVLFRLAYDLWDEVYRVQGGGEDVHFPDLAALHSFLDDFPRLPVAAFSDVEGAREHRIGVACRLHVIAPSETERLERWVAGRPDREEHADGREVSVGLGEIIGFFFKGASRDEDVTPERFSPWFVPDELPESPDPSAGGTP